MEDRTCSFESCERPTSSRNLCQGHYMQLRRGRELTPLKRQSRTTPCGFDKCGVAAVARGLCYGHHAQHSKGAALTAIDRNRPTVCSFDKCGLKVRSKGLCASHYAQHIKGLELKPVTPRPRSVIQAVCSYDGCGREHAAMSFCSTHYGQYLRGRELSPIRHRSTVALPCSVEDCGVKSVSSKGGEPLCKMHYQRLLSHGDIHRVRPAQRVTEVGTAAIRDAVANRDRSTCWRDWAELPCWSDLEGWGGKFDRGYPQLGTGPVMWVSMEADGRPRPPAPGNHGLHSCDNRACWNPDHLRWGTARENAQDVQDSRNYCQHCAHCNP